MKLKIRIKFAACLLVSLAASDALCAQGTTPADSGRDPHEVQPERPTVATHAGTVAPGWFELESGAEWDRYSNGDRVLSFPANLKFGVASNAQLNVSASGFRSTAGDPNARGLGDVTVGLKYRIVDAAKIIGDFAIEPSLKLPTAPSSRGLGTGTMDFSLLLISSRTIGPVEMDINAGETWRSGNGARTPKGASLWTVSAGVPIFGAIGWAAETFGYPGTSGEAGAKPIIAFLTGPTLQPRKWLAVDAGIIRPLSGPQPRAVYAGLVLNLGRLY